MKVRQIDSAGLIQVLARDFTREEREHQLGAWERKIQSTIRTYPRGQIPDSEPRRVCPLRLLSRDTGWAA